MAHAPLRRSLLAAFAAGALACVPRAAHADFGTRSDAFTGAWEGALDNVTGPGLRAVPEVQRMRIRLIIRDDQARVFYEEDGEWYETGVPFAFDRLGSNAVITGSHHDPQRRLGRGWVETWSFTMTLRDSDNILVNFVRVVNNNQMPPEMDLSRFSIFRTGVLQRVFIDHV